MASNLFFSMNLSFAAAMLLILSLLSANVESGDCAANAAEIGRAWGWDNTAAGNGTATTAEEYVINNGVEDLQFLMDSGFTSLVGGHIQYPNTKVKNAPAYKRCSFYGGYLPCTVLGNCDPNKAEVRCRNSPKDLGSS